MHQVCCWVMTPDGEIHCAPLSEWDSLPLNVVHAGTHGFGRAQDKDYYFVRFGQVTSIGSDQARTLAQWLGTTVEGLETDPRVKKGTWVSDEDQQRFESMAADYVLAGCRGC